MRASHEWLRAFVPHTLSPAEVERLLSTHVATVDSVEALRADLAPIVVARVIEAGHHPDSDHLWVTKVDDGSGQILDVVCGAPNVVVGTLYPFARSGTTIPTGVKIEKRKIRGAVSNGMLCSARELGLGEEHDGILALTVDVPPGTPFLSAMPIGDVRYEIDVLPNRPDLLSHIGLARELSALSHVAMQAPPELAALSQVLATPASGETIVGGVTVRVDDTEGCPLYGAAVIRGVSVGPSPDWLRDRVQSVGGRSISNVVDITNYFLHAYGQPMHAFDLGKLAGPAVAVRAARPGERLVTLDGVDRALTPDMLVIADGARAAAVAGVMGGRDAEVTEATTDIFLEVASFNPQRIRRTRRALALNTDASHRFERGTDPAGPAALVGLAAALIAAVGGGKVDGTSAVISTPLAERAAVAIKASRASRLLGAPVTDAEVTSLLTGIGFRVGTGGTDSLSVTPPSWRHDVSRDVDLVEEIARLRGYDTLSDVIAPFRVSAAPDAPLVGVTRRMRDALVAAGCAEVRPLPFVRGDEGSHLRVTNPLADDEPHLRTSVLETLARRAEFNLARREGNLRLFEIGSVFGPADAAVDERCHMGVLLMGQRRPVHFTEPEPPLFDAWDAKALAHDIATLIHPEARIALVAAERPFIWTVTANDAPIGAVRVIALDAPPWAAPAFGIELQVGALSLGAIAAPGTNAHESAGQSAVRVAPPRYRALPVMPAAEFDLAFLVPEAIEAGEVESALRRAGGEMMERLSLFDEFRGQGVPAGQRSLAWRLTFRHPERTLTEKEIAGRRQKIILTVEKELGVVARTS